MRKYSDVVPGRPRRKTLPDVSTASIAVPTCAVVTSVGVTQPSRMRDQALIWAGLEPAGAPVRSEEHTSELQSQSNLVCRLLLEKKNTHKLETPLSNHLSHKRAWTVNKNILYNVMF